MRFLSSLLASVLGTLIALGVVLVFMVLLFAALILGSDQTPRVRTGTVLTVPLAGAIPDVAAADPFMQVFGDGPRYDLMDLTSSLEKAAADDRISAVWLQFRNLQASWTTLYEIREAVERFKASGKPVMASSNDFTMSESDYFLASVADSVFAAPGAMFEYNGFFIMSTFFKRLMDNMQIEPEIVRAGQFKSATEPFTREDLSPENQEQLNAILATQNDVFMELVGRSRGIAVEELSRLAESEAILTTERAFEVGLLDRLAYDDEVRDLIKSRTGANGEDDLRTIPLHRYARVPASDAGLPRGDDGEIAVVHATGTIMSGRSDDSPFGSSGTVGSATFNDAMKTARESERVDAVVLRIDSPGGSAAASDVMWREIALTAAQKPLVVSMGNLAASGGYWIATGGETIVASPLTITGSIGVFSILFDASGFFEEKLGITFDGVRTSPYADIFSGVRPLGPNERDLLQRWTDETYRQFLVRVSDARNMDTSAVNEIGQGRIWSGRDAQRVGLVDEVGTLRRAIEMAAERAGLAEGSYSVRVLPRPRTVLEQINENLSASARRLATYVTMSRDARLLGERLRPMSDLLRDMNSVQARIMWDIEVR